ncbi:hypothetical protein PGT21_036651 [Puccinia graminis f. sp. tritici]|uniref:Uncharacterized protein n=1 Tax=Puccinia graminis f. sp. tritici TaxID=56615 RepID=A0A5B0PBV4_PUCGR|nr:hypothetical protein PGT21_036651 [Puccinia graminis f. sp. tritici]KAA1100427.1 hypothetical protein PGTUg99_027855 [Puccinia graminis f. sp. tritici]
MPSVALSQEVQPERLAVALQKKYCILFFALLAITRKRKLLHEQYFRISSSSTPSSSNSLLIIKQPTTRHISIRPKANRCPVISRSAVTQSKNPPGQSVPSQRSWLIV